MITDNSPERTDTLVVWRVITPRDWAAMQRYQMANPGFTIEHILDRIFVVAVPSEDAEAA
jgi:hypothetical protein